jgi:hypothetical protein
VLLYIGQVEKSTRILAEGSGVDTRGKIDRTLAVMAISLAALAVAMAGIALLREPRDESAQPGAAALPARFEAPAGDDPAPNAQDAGSPMMSVDDAANAMFDLLEMNHNAIAALADQRLDFRLQSLESWARLSSETRPTRFYRVASWKIPGIYSLAVSGVAGLPSGSRYATLMLRPDKQVGKLVHDTLQPDPLHPEPGAWEWTARGLLVALPAGVLHVGGKTLLFRRAIADEATVDAFTTSAPGMGRAWSSVRLIRDRRLDAAMGDLRRSALEKYVAAHGHALDAADPKRP